MPTPARPGSPSTPPSRGQPAHRRHPRYRPRNGTGRRRELRPSRRRPWTLPAGASGVGSVRSAGRRLPRRGAGTRGASWAPLQQHSRGHRRPRSAASRSAFGVGEGVGASVRIGHRVGPPADGACIRPGGPYRSVVRSPARPSHAAPSSVLPTVTTPDEHRTGRRGCPSRADRRAVAFRVAFRPRGGRRTRRSRAIGLSVVRGAHVAMQRRR